MIGDTKIRIVMRDGNDCLSGKAQPLHHIVIEISPELRILVRGPFVEKVDRLVFDQPHQKREPAALTVGQASQRISRAIHKQRTGEAKFVQQLLEVIKRMVRAHQVIEQMEIAIDGRKHLPIFIHREYRHTLPVK